MSASNSATTDCNPSRLDSLTNCSGGECNVSWQLNIHVISGRFAYCLKQRRRVVLVGKSIRCPISARLTYLLQKQRGAVSAGVPTLTHLGRIYLLRQRGEVVLASDHYTPSQSDSLTNCGSEEAQCQLAMQYSLTPGRFTYSLHPRRRAAPTVNLAPIHFTPSRTGSLTPYRSEGEQC